MLHGSLILQRENSKAAEVEETMKSSPLKVLYMTPEGHAKLEQELERLRTVRRSEVARRIHEAIEEGGELEENAAYEVAKTEQAFLEGRIQEIEKKLARASIVAPGEPTGVAKIGSLVVIQQLDQAPQTYSIVGSTEADPRHGKISWESPLGQALLNHREGEEIEYKAPDGTFRCKILKIQ
jgi:transcription elongation factor GreA